MNGPLTSNTASKSGKPKIVKNPFKQTHCLPDYIQYIGKQSTTTVYNMHLKQENRR